MKAYQIKDWDKIFENSDSRKLKNLNWVPMPNSWDGLGYIRVTKHKNAVSILAAWLLVVEIGSKCPQRGLLAKVDAPLSVEDMQDLTRMPAELFKKALEALTDPLIGWVEVVEINRSSRGDWEILPVSTETSGNDPDASGRSGLVQNRTEQNGIEQKTLSPERQATVVESSKIKENSSAPDPRHSQIVKGWCEGYEKAYGRKYPLNGGKEGKHLKQFLERCKEPPSEIIAMAGKAWDRAKMPYSKFCKNAATLGGFCDHYAGIIAELAESNGNQRRKLTTIADHAEGW
jgi:hypothetical protein